MKCCHFNNILTESHRYFIDSPEDDNCVLCLINRKGPMTQEEVGEYMGLSKMRISQLQKSAQKRFLLKLIAVNNLG